MYSFHRDSVDDDDDTNSLLLSLSPMTNGSITEPSECNHGLYNPSKPFSKKKRYQLSIDISTSTSRHATPIKGNIRCVDEDLGHLQIYSGKKWRRICSIPGCFASLSGSIYYKYWLCPRHCPRELKTHTSNNLENMLVDTEEEISLLDDKTEKRVTRKSSHQIKPKIRGDIISLDDGTRQKYDGKIWRSVCSYGNCKCLAVRHGFCRPHVSRFRKKKSKSSPKLHDTKGSTSPSPGFSLTSESQFIPSTSINDTENEKGDIQTIRQKWDGTQWHSLCQYYTGDCIQYSGGLEHEFLCDEHFKIHQANKNDEYLLSPTIKQREQVIDDIYKDFICFLPQKIEDNQIEELNQCVQSDSTYPLDFQESDFLNDHNNIYFKNYPAQTSELFLFFDTEDISN